MRTRCLVLAVVLIASPSATRAQQPLRLTIADGRVTLHAQNTPVRTILAEWARLGGATVVNGERVAGPSLTLDLEGVPERQALGIVLRGVSGYLLAAKEQDAPGASMFGRIVILPTSAAPRSPQPSPAPVAARPGFPVAPNGLVRPGLRPPDGADADAAASDDGVQMPRPVPPQRPAASQTGLPGMPPAPLGTPEETPAPAPPAVVVTPSNPFGIPAGSSARPGVITTPPPQTPREAPQN